MKRSLKILFVCMSAILALRADHQLEKFASKVVHEQSDDAKFLTTLTRFNPERIVSQVESFQAELRRRIRIRYATYGVLGAAGVGLVSYGAYRYLAPRNSQALQAQEPEFQQFDQAQREAIEAAQRQAIQRYYESLEQRGTFSGHVKEAAWHGAEFAIGSFICGLILSSLSQGQEFTKAFLPSLFVGDREEYLELYLKVKKSFSRLQQTLQSFSMREETGEHCVYSDVLYGHFCGQIVADYTALIYTLESLMSFLFVYGEYHNVQNLDSIRCGADVIDGLVHELAGALESVINRADQQSLAGVATHFRNSFVYVIKFMCSCGEALYGDSFNPV